MATNQEQKSKAGADNASNSKKSFFHFFKNVSKHQLNMDDGQITKFMKVTGLILLSLLSVFVFVKTINEVKNYSTIGEYPMPPYSIYINGKGEVSAPKDQAVLTFSSNGKGKTAVDSESAAAVSVNKALAFLKEKGIEDKNISTVSHGTYPTYDQKVKPCVVDAKATVVGSAPVSAPSSVKNTLVAEPAIMVAPIAPCNSYESVVSGYETYQSVEVKISGIDKNTSLSGEIVTGLTAAGVQVSAVENRIANSDALKAEARALAIADAKQQANQIARSLGIKLGKVVSFSDNDMYPNAAPMMYSADAGMEKSVSPQMPAGEAKITSNISVSFEIR